MKTANHQGRGRPADDTLPARRCDEILHAAAALFAANGYAETTTQLLADRLGVGKGTIYRYFPTKQDLFLAAVDRVMRQARDEIDRMIEGVEDPLVKMEVAFGAYLRFFGEHPGFVELLMMERAQFKDRLKPTYFEHYEKSVPEWQETFRQLIGAKRVRDVPVERITDVLSDLLYGTMFTNYFTGRCGSPADQARDILDVAFRGILSDSERNRQLESNVEG